MYRLGDEFYGKFKAGFLSEDFSFKNSFGSVDSTDSGFSGGIGAGYRYENFSIEAEYTLIEQDVDFFSIGVNFHF